MNGKPASNTDRILKEVSRKCLLFSSTNGIVFDGDAVFMTQKLISLLENKVLKFSAEKSFTSLRCREGTDQFESHGAREIGHDVGKDCNLRQCLNAESRLAKNSRFLSVYTWTAEVTQVTTEFG